MRGGSRDVFQYTRSKRRKPVQTPRQQPAKKLQPQPSGAAPAGPNASQAQARRPQTAAEVAEVQDKERKRKERLGEIKIELHRELLENLNLAALENAASRPSCVARNQPLPPKSLKRKSIVLNREDRQQLNKELYDEVTGLGPLETLLQDDTVSDILVNGPQQIFVERVR